MEPTPNKNSLSQRLLRLLGAVTATGLLLWVLQLAIQQWQQLPPLEQVNVPLLLSGLLLVMLGHLQLMFGWQRILQWLGVSPTLKEIFFIYSISILGRYIPGKILVLVGKVTMLGRIGIPRGVAIKSVSWEICLIVIAAGLLCLLTPDKIPGTQLPFRIVGYFTGSTLAGIIGWFFSRNGTSDILQILKIVLQYLILWLLLGFGFLLISRSLIVFSMAEEGFSIISSYAFVHMTSALALFVPAGLGLREWGLQWVLSASSLEPISGVLALLMRALLTSLEVFYAVVAFSLWRKSVGVEPTAAKESS